MQIQGRLRIWTDTETDADADTDTDMDMDADTDTIRYDMDTDTRYLQQGLAVSLICMSMFGPSMHLQLCM